MDISPTNTATGFPHVEDSSFRPHSGHQDHPEEVPSGLLQGSPYSSAPDLRPLPSIRRVEGDQLYSSQTLPQTPSAEMNVTGDTSRILVPLPEVHPSIPTRPISWTGRQSNKFGDYKALPPSLAMRGRTQDILTATTSSGMTSTHLPSSNQAPELCTCPAVHLPNSTSNDECLLNPYSTHDEVAPSDSQLDTQERQLVTTVTTSPPPSRVSAHRNSKKYWCYTCDTGFSQKQGFNRHKKGKHSQ